ncbi:MAG: thioredoxin family protein [Oleiphilaceae bacterium]|nr:thioredoxin family protein [Oleiphilaceae bacterium]
MARHGKSSTTKTQKVKRKKITPKTLKKLGISAVFVAFLGVCLTAYSHVIQTTQDLSVIGNGTATVVQVHDPNCPNCAQLKRNVDALQSEYDEDIQFKIANLANKKGKTFAGKYQAPKTTLLLFNKHGRLTNTLHGITSKEDLRVAFNQLTRR